MTNTIKGSKAGDLRYTYNIVLVQMVDVIAGHARNNMDLPSDAEAGKRFNDNHAILSRLESWVAPEEFAMSPLKYIKEALLDAAKADYWYNHEKNYGHDNDNF